MKPHRFRIPFLRFAAILTASLPAYAQQNDAQPQPIAGTLHIPVATACGVRIDHLPNGCKIYIQGQEVNFQLDVDHDCTDQTNCTKVIAGQNYALKLEGSQPELNAFTTPH